MIFLASTEIGFWLLQQAPVIVVMGVVIWWLADKFNTSEKNKDDLAKDVIKLTTLWEEKSSKVDDKNEKDNDKILELLQEIKFIVQNYSK